MKRLLPLLLMLSLTGCGEPPPTGPTAGPTAWRPAAASSADRYVIDPGASLLTVTVRRGGLLARLGHDHVVASHTLAGYVAPGAGRAEITFRLDQMSIDEPKLLRDAGIATQPSPQAVEGTRKNMLGPVLEAQRFPVAALHAERLADSRLRVAVTLHGVTGWLELAAAVQVDAAMVTATGTARLKQTDFGMTPFSIGGGLLSVQDELEVHYRIVARR
jgi:polyisoprenoid-binding protein YceI